MTSTFVNDLRLNEMATGDQSGSWGTVTNTNLELIGEALGYGTEGITTNANTHTSTIADGATDPVRALYVEYTGTLDSACTVTIAPNTVNKVCFIENGTSGSQNIIIKQGSGATITIPPGDTKAVYLDGAGSGAKVVDAFASLSVVDLKVQDDLTVTDDVAIGGLATIGETLAVTGVLTTTAAAVFNGGFTSNGDTVTFASGNADDPIIIIKNTTNDASSAGLQFVKDKGAAGADGDDIGQIDFIADNDAQQQTTFVSILSEVSTAADGAEGGKYSVRLATHDGEMQAGLLLQDGNAEDEIDVTIGSGTSSVTTIAGTLTSTGNITLGDTVITDGSITDTGNLTLDVAGNIILDADGAEIIFKDGGTTFGRVYNSNGNFFINAPTNNTDIIFQGVDGGNDVNALELDMSAGGQATFSNDIIMPGSIYHTGDLDTFFGFPSANTIKFTTGNVEAFVVSPTDVVVNESGGNMNFRVEAQGNANAIVVDASENNVCFGSPQANGTVNMGYFHLGANNCHLNVTNTQNGNTTALIYANRQGSNGTSIFFQRSASVVGSISVTTGGTAYNESSDYRLKENVVYDWDATTRLKRLKPARFNFIADADTTVDGFLAHEVQAVVPESVFGTHNETSTLTKVVLSSSNTVLAEDIEQSDWTAGKSATTDEDGNAVAAIYPSDSTWAAEHVVPVIQQFDKSKLVPLLVKTIQELEARITALENA